MIRAAHRDDAREISILHVDTWRAAYPDIVPKAYLDGLSYDDSEQFWRDLLSGTGNGGVFVAGDESRIFGFASGRLREDFSKGLTEYEGELNTIYVLPSHQGARVGGHLIAAVSQYFLDLGVESMLLWVFAENQAARSFYESLGGTLVADDGFEIGGAWVTEVAYGWRSLSALMERI